MSDFDNMQPIEKAAGTYIPYVADTSLIDVRPLVEG